MSPEAIALARVEATESWRGWSDPKTIGAAPDVRQYLQNRLRAAFLLGVQSGVEIAAKRVRNIALGKTHPID